MHRRFLRAAGLAALAIVLSLPLHSVHAQQASPLTQLAGNWNGSGTVRLEGGGSERLACRGYYTANPGGAGLGLALRCASSSAKIDLRSSLRYRDGRVTGSWEERSYNASGNVEGRALNGSMNLNITGGGLTGTMAVSFSGPHQSVTITTAGTGLRGVFISLRRG